MNKDKHIKKYWMGLIGGVLVLSLFCFSAIMSFCIGIGWYYAWDKLIFPNLGI